MVAICYQRHQILGVKERVDGIEEEAPSTDHLCEFCLGEEHLVWFSAQEFMLSSTILNVFHLFLIV
jgi:hypothetical protein